MNKILLKSIVLFLLLGVNNLFGQTTYLVKDLSTITPPSDPKCFTKSGSLVYFSAYNSTYGRELWRTDGTPQGTFMVKDINSGTNSGTENPNSSYTDIFTDINGQLFFIAKDNSLKKQLWKTNGTQSGTVVLTNFAAGIDNVDEMLNINGTLYFVPNSRELWKIGQNDTQAVLITNQLSTAGILPKKYLANYNGTLVFIGYDATHGYELWKSDGTTSGTVLVKDINPGTSSAFPGGPNDFNPNFKTINGVLYFAAKDDINGIELWKSDGTEAGTTRIKDINPTGDSYPAEFTLFNNEIFFRANEPSSGYELWKTDGTSTGTTMVINIDSTVYNSVPQNFNIINNSLCFTANNNSKLFKSDGTAIGTVPILRGATSFSIKDLEVKNNDLYISFVDTLGNAALWLGDVITGNFQLLKDIYYGNNENIANLTSLNGNIIFSAKDTLHSNELWISDGTSTGTKILKDINDVIGSSNIEQLADVNGTLFFSGCDDVHGGELWKSNGNGTGTNMVIDANPTGNSNPYYPVSYHNLLYYRGAGGPLWKSDGTASGTIAVSNGNTGISNLRVVDDILFFRDTYGRLCRSDGTETGTVIIFNQIIEDFIKVGNNVFVQEQFGLSNVDLTKNSTINLNYSNYLYYLTNFNNTLYFSGCRTVNDTIWRDETNYYINENMFWDLWKSDGTANGTVSLNKQIGIGGMISINNTLYISGKMNNVSGLYHTSSPSDSISLIKEIIPGGNSNCSNFFNVNGKLFFTVDDGVNGNELWVSDGTTTGTLLVKNINVTGSSFPANFVTKNGILYFTANDGIHGIELWKSDGTNTGTSMVADVNANVGSNPEQLTISGDYVYFVADDGIHGKELWTYGINTTANCFAYYTTSYDTLLNNFNIDVDSTTKSQAISYLWDFGDGVTSTLENPTHHYSTDGIYNVCLKAYSAFGDSCLYCHEIGKDSLGNIAKNGGFTITANQIPSDAGMISGATTVCQGQNEVSYSVPIIANATSYIWTLPNGATGVSSTKNITVDYGTSAVSGNITVKGINVVGEGTLSTLPITVAQTPATPIISNTGNNVLGSNAATGNQWYNQNGIINGAVSQTYATTANGSYYVVVKVGNCYSDTSNHIQITNTGIENFNSNDSFSVYPNPTKSSLNVTVNQKLIGAEFSITDQLGRKVIIGKLTAENTVVELGNLSNGLYLLRIGANAQQTFKVVKE